jgi:hypothetical protein
MALAEGGPQGMQRLLNFYAWDVDGVRDDVRAVVAQALGEVDGSSAHQPQSRTQ